MTGRGKRYLLGLSKYLNDEHRRIYGTPIDASNQFTTMIKEDSPKQQNSNDCGAFQCLTADLICQQQQINLLFSQNNIPPI